MLALGNGVDADFFQPAADRQSPFAEDETAWLQDLGQLYERGGQLAKSESYYRQAIDARRLTFGDRHPRMLNSQQGLARTLAAQKKFAEAEPILRNALALRLEIDGGDSVKSANAMGELASLLQDRGKYAEALGIYRDELAIDERLAGKSVQYAVTLNNVATLLEDMGDDAAAEIAYLEALAILVNFSEILSADRTKSVHPAASACRGIRFTSADTS